MPGWLGGSQPRPAGREALRSITPERTQIPSPGERSHPALRARKHFQLWSHPTLTFPHLSYPFRALGMGTGPWPWSGSPSQPLPPRRGCSAASPVFARGSGCPFLRGRRFPPLPKGPGPRLQIKWKWGIQRLHRPAAEGKNRRSCSLRPSSFFIPTVSPIPIQQHLPRGPPPSFPGPLPGAPRAARCQQQGEGQGR